MSVVDRDRFLQCVAKSGVLKKDVHEKWMSEIDADADSKTLAKDLIRRKLVTRWQGKMLAKGASRLSLGNYLLTDRMAKSEFGDRFSAVHRQLSRNVAIQYLPANVCDTKEAKKKIFAFGSKLADLDHPNLVHVYDIDEEKNRIYLVSESVNGKSLEDCFDNEQSFSCESIAKILSGCLKGLNYAHAKGVVHGGISTTTVAVEPQGNVKIQGLTECAIQNALAESPVDVKDDLSAVETLGGSLLKSVGEDERTDPSFAALQKAIEGIEKDPKATIDVLNDLVQSGVQAKAQGQFAVEEMTLAPETDRAPVSSHPAVAVASAGQPIPSSNSDKPISFEESKDGFLTSLARRNPAALIGASVVSALLLIGGTVFAATQFSAAPGSTAVANLSEEAGTVKGSKPASKPKKKSRKDAFAKKVDRPNFRNKQGALSDTVSATLARDAVTNPEANKAAIDALFNKTPVKKEVVPVEVAKKDNAVSVPVVKTEPASEAMPAAPTPEEVVAVVTPKKSATVVVQQTKVSATADDVLAPGADPFDKFAKMVDLPDATSTDLASFGKLILEKKHLLGAEILSTPLAHRSKPIFVMSRSAEDKQTWDIGYKKKKKSDPVVVAKLQKTPNELRFNWLPEAAEINAANYLRNCRIKLSTAKHSHWLTLRKPVKIEGFKLPKDRGSVKLDVDIPFLPNSLALSAGLNGIKFERLNTEDWEERPHMEPAEITPTVPGRMYFHKDADRFLSLDVLADIRKKLTLRAALVMQPSPEQPGRVLEDPRTMPQVAQQIRNSAMMAQNASNQAQSSKLTADQKDVYKKAAKKATDQAELTAFYEHVVPQLLEKDIPVTITYALNDQHRILLAYTVETEETKEK